MSEEKEGIGTWFFAIVFWVVFLVGSLLLLPFQWLNYIYDDFGSQVHGTKKQVILLIILGLALWFLATLIFPLIP